MHTDKAVAWLDRQMKKALQQHGLTGGKTLVVAVSGGPDSLALLFALCRLKGELGLELHGAHLDHGLRGDASEADARFVSSVFHKQGVAFTTERADVPSFQRTHRLSPEEAAREVRYGFLAQVASERRADAIALGHTSDDQAETVLMNIMRGSGLTGLRGMEPTTRRTFAEGEVLLVRPLLSASREDTLSYCRALGLEPRLDLSNQSTELRRNRVRLELLPLLEEYNPAIREALIRLSRSAAEEVAHLDSLVDGIWHEAVRREREYVSLKKDVLGRLSTALQAHLLRRAVAEVKGDLNELEQTHIDDMVRLVGGPAGRTLDLPGGIRFSTGYAEATVATARHDPCPLPALEGEHPLAVPGETLVCGWRVSASVVEQSTPEPRSPRAAAAAIGEAVHDPSMADYDRREEYGPDGLRACMSHDVLGGGLRVRARRPGDRFQPLGMSGQKKLQDFMVDAKIPRQWRGRVPLVVSLKGIAWVAGWRIADWAKVKDGEFSQLELVFAPQDGQGERG